MAILFALAATTALSAATSIAGGVVGAGQTDDMKKNSDENLLQGTEMMVDNRYSTAAGGVHAT